MSYPNNSYPQYPQQPYGQQQPNGQQQQQPYGQYQMPQQQYPIAGQVPLYGQQMPYAHPGQSYAPPAHAPPIHAPPPYAPPAQYQQTQPYGAYPQQQQQQQQPPYGAPPSQYPAGPPASAPLYGQQAGYSAPPTNAMNIGAASYGNYAMSAPGYDPTADVQSIIRATKGFGTDEKALIAVLAKKSPAQMDVLRTAFLQTTTKSLKHVIEKETSGYFETALIQIVNGPLASDVENVNDAIAGAGTNENMLNDIILSRSNSDLDMLKNAYQQRYHKNLAQEVSDDLSFKTKKMFEMVLHNKRQNEWDPIDPQRIQNDVTDLYRATQGRIGTDEIFVCSIITSRSDNQLRAIAQQYFNTYHKKLVAVIEDEFSSHMKKALSYIIKMAVNKPTCCAEMLEDSMAGFGTKDKLLVERLVRYHWDPALLHEVKIAYRSIYKKDLISRVKGETSGDYKRLLAAILE
ncbi:hypothetical protein V1511DRAFT_511433 [Dipodascopsis uninucleata]